MKIVTLEAVTALHFRIDGSDDNSAIEPKRKIFDVMKIGINPGAGFRRTICRASQTTHLGKPCETWTHRMALMILRNKGFIRYAGCKHTNGVAAWPDNRHITTNDIYELWQFIDVKTTQIAPHLCDPRIAYNGLRNPTGIAFVCVHRTEFIDLDFLPVHPPTGLREECPARTFTSDQANHCQQKWCQHDKSERS